MSELVAVLKKLAPDADADTTLKRAMEAANEALAVAKRAADPTLTYEQAYSRALDTPLGRRLYVLGRHPQHADKPLEQAARLIEKEMPGFWRGLAEEVEGPPLPDAVKAEAERIRKANPDWDEERIVGEAWQASPLALSDALWDESMAKLHRTSD